MISNLLYKITLILLFVSSFFVFSQKKCSKRKNKSNINKCVVKVWKDSLDNKNKDSVFKMRRKKRRYRNKKNRHVKN